jgi:hypothetical protein
MAATSLGAPGAAFAQAEAPAAGEAAAQAPADAKSAGTGKPPARAMPAGRPAAGVMPVRWSTMPTSAKADPNPDMMFFAGTCGASAAVSLDDERVIVGSDDDNLIRTYDLVEPADLVVKDDSGEIDPALMALHRPRASQNFYPFTKVHQFSRRNFSAIEGAAVGDGFVFWAGSHGRRRDGENRPNRRRFFATKIVHFGATPILEPYGEPVVDLVQQIESAESLHSAGLTRSIMSLHRRLEHLAPEVRGFEIQALSMAGDGRTLLIGLRSPSLVNKAIVVPLVNPQAVAEGERAIFGDPIYLALGGRTISAMEWVPALESQLILAAKTGAHDGFVLYRWSGKSGEEPVLLQELPEELDAQSFIVSADATRVLVFSDDSEVRYPVSGPNDCQNRIENGTCACNKLTDHGPKKFRAIWVPIELGKGAGQGGAVGAASPAISAKP